MHLPKKLFLAGNPNSGKTSVFNTLTGLYQKVGNFTGVTVDKKTGVTTLPNGNTLEVMDLPGTYSLHPTSAEEKIVLQTLLHPDVLADKPNILYIADAANLERHLLLLTQLICLQFPVILGITMTDLQAKDSQQINYELLSKSLNIPVFVVNGRTGEGLNDIKQYLATQNPSVAPVFMKEVAGVPDGLLVAVKKILGVDNNYVAALHLEHVEVLPFLTSAQVDDLKAIGRKYGFESLHAQIADTMQRFEKIMPVIRQTVFAPEKERSNLTSGFDRWLTHPVGGLFFFVLVLFGIFQAIFSVAAYPMEWIEWVFSQTSVQLQKYLPDSMLTSLLTDGILSGLSGIVIFVPQIAILFLLIGILEETGYMSRAVYLSDSLMSRFGMNGRSLVSLFSGMACAVPAVMAARTISNPKERLLTILVTPLVSCSARIPVFTILIALLIPVEASVGILNAQGLMMMALYLTGIFAALLVAYVLKRFVKSSEPSFLALELPPYKMPHWKNLFINAVQKVKIFVVEAGKIILIISLLLWVSANFGPGNKMEDAENQVITKYQQAAGDNSDLDAQIAEARLENSYIGHVGKWIEPVIEPIGFDWKIGIALLTSFAAREVFVGTMATIYSVGGNDETTLRQKMSAEINPKTNLPMFNTATTLSLLVFYIFAMQCMSTLAVVKRETNSWKWALVQLVYMTVLAYTASWAVFRIFQ
ncbi:MAG: ferrous iron transport protein B [Sphingobacteriales bacterium]|nr:MAG: ferrous iron transport protein B [Sphingobacteriales bacterium]